MTASADSVWSMKVLVEDVPDTGAHFDLSADESTRAELARAAGLRDLTRLQASFDVSRHGRDGLRVVGEVSATIGQNCVVTLEPMESELCEPIDLVFSAADQSAAPREATVQVGAGEAPEILTGGAVDLGAVATEFLLLGIDPYPRKPGAVFESVAAGDPGAHPFAALSALKKGKGGSES